MKKPIYREQICKYCYKVLRTHIKSNIIPVKTCGECSILNKKKYLKEYTKNNKYKIKQTALLRKTKDPKKHRLYIKNNQLLTAFRIRLTDYNKMLEEQKGVCAICFKVEHIKDKRTDRLRMLSVDHCHKTGKVRGLLCQACNTSLGRIKEDRKTLINMILYIDKHAQMC